MTTVGFRRTENVTSPPNESQLFNDMDFFDEVQPELIQTWLKEGKTQMDLENYEDAGEYMRTVVVHAKAIQYEGRVEAIEEAMNLLAKCYCNLDELHNAEATLLELLNDNTRTALQEADTKHALADVYITRQNYPSAEESCRDAIRTKSRILSRNHESVHTSICLLVHILEAKGENHVAAGYKVLLPPEMRISQDESSLITEMLKRAGIRETLRNQLTKLSSMSSHVGAEKLGREFFKDLIPRKPCSESRDLQWAEIRFCFGSSHLVGVPSRYSLVHACTEYGHEVLLNLLSEFDANIHFYDSQSNQPLARAIIGAENGIKVPAAISRILLENGTSLHNSVNSEGVFALQKYRSSPQKLYYWAKDGKWPWPETRDLAMEKAKQQGF